MVRLLKRGHGLGKPYDEEGDEEGDAALRQLQSQILEGVGWNGSAYDDDNYGVLFHGLGEAGAGRPLRALQIDRSSCIGWRPRLSKDGSAREATPSELESMKDRYAKLLLGEDMSGGGRGVSSALALSNAFTNLAASVFSEQTRLEPMPDERKARWRREIDWLLSVTDHIVEFVPSRQTSKDGVTIEIMMTQQRKDLQMNIPALHKLDAMLIGSLDDFKDQNMFWYDSRDGNESEKGSARRKDDKWWLPTVRVPPNGLPEESSRWIQLQKESASQVHKAAMAINAQVLMGMEVPEAYVESLPKNGRSSLGDAIYKFITDDVFDPEEFLRMMDLSTEHRILDLKNRIEASVVIWKRKMQDMEGKHSWSSAVSLGKRELFEERAEILLILIKQRFPAIPQSALEISKIQYNKDVGLAILESYSRVLESLAFVLISRIDDVLYADSLAKGSTTKCPKGRQPKLNAREETESASLMSLSEFMSWDCETGHGTEMRNAGGGTVKKPPEVKDGKKFCYLVERVGGMKSPAARH
ncbi:rho guanine nucleotide exchange factor 8-like [Curcuma longa]|uniref:rho guanine nucleotide exchange factor 8-like n=1 Tax=Curcuma longa TaxID=136217 RepID=UPI003D9FA1D0